MVKMNSSKTLKCFYKNTLIVVSVVKTCSEQPQCDRNSLQQRFQNPVRDAKNTAGNQSKLDF